MEKINQYEANRYTMAIISSASNGSLSSYVLEVEKEYEVSMRPLDIVDRSCRYFGSSYQGRKTGTKDTIGITHKPPIVVDAVNSIYLFPTAASSRPQCSWISHQYIEHYSSTGEAETLVTFSNRKSYILPVSIHSFENQLYRTAQLRAVITSRVENEKRMFTQLLYSRSPGETFHT
ncbi:competence protein [Bacillus sp. FJAT-42376]|uniref:competence protein ComK n=1 Tax=Bacillus sp. FJAT-42376 TaxID=2014076 RepID=UPI000F50A5D5|nr:competence protein ComK [Bacillus sp. FJAT-42376]AZB42272.1 competence protein [Bacillus sp. FJAT-42376]